MRISEIKNMIEAAQLPATYLFWPEDDPEGVPALPYIVWHLPNSNNFNADDKVYRRIDVLHIELYTATKDFNTEFVLEAILDNAGMVWEKQETYLNTEHMFDIEYTMEVIIDGE